MTNFEIPGRSLVKAFIYEKYLHETFSRCSFYLIDGRPSEVLAGENQVFVRIIFVVECYDSIHGIVLFLNNIKEFEPVKFVLVKYA